MGSKLLPVENRTAIVDSIMSIFAAVGERVRRDQRICWRFLLCVMVFSICGGSILSDEVSVVPWSEGPSALGGCAYLML